MTLKEFADNEWQKYDWQKYDDEFFADHTNIMDANKLNSKCYTISNKSLKTYAYFDELCGLLLFSNISDLIGDKKHDKKYHVTFENRKSNLQLNKRDKNSGI